MTKEDYMKLSKERLAELLVERDREPAISIPYTTHPQCFEPGGVCTNPHRDCINCPGPISGTAYWSTTTNQITKDDEL